ncbi:hypothetical protein EYZ11_011380 [Aspergillus tanneri]|uniref:Ubiquitin carboxyl-terminal hydrolase 19 n=1 Tax=Aspergillus tanneri TaxID=1220188 RepID=A0A4S3J2Y2_9EURO|nr:hypothetical protein EYZ11_011380 [Aspergillus tanneri]
MDAQYPFASRDDIWRVFEELKELHAAQFEQAERIARLERRRDEDAKLRSVWGPLSPFPNSVGGTVPTEPVFHTPSDAFKGFDQGQHHGVVTTMGLDSEDEPRRGTSRANSVRFDESAIHGYYGQTSRSSSELPMRTGSGMGSHPLTERSLSHRSDGRQSSSVLQEDDLHYIKLPMYLPEASVHQASSRSSSPVPQLPTLTIRFLVRDVDPRDPSVQIVIGSDVLRSHNADVLFSQDKIIMVDDERNKVSIPLVRPEDDSVFRSLRTVSDTSRSGGTEAPSQTHDQPDTNGHTAVGVIGRPSSLSQPRSAPESVGDSIEEPEESRKAHSLEVYEPSRNAEHSQIPNKPTMAPDSQTAGSVKTEPSGVWGSWKREIKLDPNASAAGKAPARPMKVLRPTKFSSRTPPVAGAPRSSSTEPAASSRPASSRASPDESRTGKQWGSNPVGGASAFGWLNSSQSPTRAVTNPK